MGRRIGFFLLAAIAALMLFSSAIAVDHGVKEWKASRQRVLEQVANSAIDRAAALNRLRIAEAALRSRDSASAATRKAKIAAIRSIPVPDTCTAVVAERDAIIDQQEVDLQSQRDFIQYQGQTYEGIISRMETHEGNLIGLVKEAPLRGKTGLSRFLPHLSAGLGIVVGKDAQPHAGISVQLGWDF